MIVNPSRSGPRRLQPGERKTLRLKSWRCLDVQMERGVRSYDRARDLPRLMPQLLLALPEEMPGTALIIAWLERALMRERSLGQSGHWSYDLRRHMALARALAAERAAQKDTTPNTMQKGATLR